MDAWMRTAGLIDILSRAQSQPTWNAFEGPQAAALDRVLMPRDSALSVNMQIHWPQPSQVFDHALIVTRLHHSIAGIGFTGASRLESEDVLPPRARIDLQKLRTQIPELQRLSHISLTLMEEEHQRRDRPPDPFEALKEGELIVSSIAQALASNISKLGG